MNFFLALFLAGVILAIIAGFALIVTWAVLVFVYLPLTTNSSVDLTVIYASAEFVRQLARFFPLIVTSTYNAIVQLGTNAYRNLLVFLVFVAISGAFFIVLEYHDKIIYTYIQFRQCGIRPLVDSLIFPILNLGRIIYNLIIPIVNFFANVGGFIMYGAPVILFKCTESSLSIAQLFSYVAIFFKTLFRDFSNWITNQPLSTDFTILASIEAFANIFIAAIPTLDCFCRALHFIWVYLLTLIGLESLAATLNFAWIFFINIFQTPFRFLQDPTKQANFTGITLNACGAVISAGDFVEEVLLLTSETFFGLLTQGDSLPEPVKAALSIRYAHIITHPVCGLFRVVNMTLVATVSFRSVIDRSATNNTGVAFFQFGHVFDEFKLATLAIGDFGDLLSNDLQSLINGLLGGVVDFFAFLFEWVIGNFFYEITGGPLPASFGLYNVTTPSGAGLFNFWQYYFVDYWFKAIPLGANVTGPIYNTTTNTSIPNATEIVSPVTIDGYTYSSALNSFFDNLFRATQSLGNLIGLFMAPLGQAVRHFLNALIALILFLANFVSYSFCFFTAQCSNMPITARDVNIDLFFNETYLFAGAAGDIFRQYDNASCQNNTLDANKTILCLSGNIIETTLDVIILVAKEYTHFVQDVLTLPTGQVKPCLFEVTNVSRKACLRIPDLTTAITELDDDLCDFAYLVTSLVPPLAALSCPFAPATGVTRTCTAVQTCLGFEFCSILRFIPVILQLVNTLIINIISGTVFSSFDQFLQTVVTSLVNQFAVVLEQFAVFLDCSICAAEEAQSSGCTSPIFDIIHPIADAVRELAKVITGVFLDFVKSVVLLFVGLFSGNPVTAIIDFVFAFLQNVLTGIGFGLVDFIAQLLDKIGLGFLGTFIQILYKGFCVVLEGIVNSIIVILKVLSFGYFSHDYVQFCCSDGGCQPHIGTRKRMEEPIVVNGTALVNMDNWLKVIALQPIFSPEDACNASIIAYADIPFTELDTYHYGEILFCSAKAIWPLRNDNQTVIKEWNCDRLYREYVNRSFASFTIFEQGELMDCAVSRLGIELVRYGFDIPWLPQDLVTNPWRVLWFTGGLLHGFLLNTQFFNDKTFPTAVILSPSYQAFWRNIHVDTSQYDKLKTPDDVIHFRETLHLRSYFEKNEASQYDATLYTVSNLWKIGDIILSGLTNMTDAFSDNVTDMGLYLAYNYSQDTPTHASVSGFLGILSSAFGMITNLTHTWSDPANYKKRSEAYGVISAGTYTLYTQAGRQLQLMAQEYTSTKVYEGTHFYNQTCGSEEQCRAAGVTQFREAYEASMRGEDELRGATSLVFKASRFWDNLDFTTYPIRNARYAHCRVQSAAPPLTYRNKHGETIYETYPERFWRYYAAVKTGTRAAQRRWQIVTQIYESTRDKIYTQALKHLYKTQYITTPHHKLMKARYQLEQSTRKHTLSSSTPQSTVCRGSQCVKSYQLENTEFEYDMDRLVTQNQINQSEVRRLNTFTVFGTTGISTAALTVSNFFNIPCMKEISFPCLYPLECAGNTTTTLCVQCVYVQVLIDRVIAASDQLFTYFAEDGQFSRSLAIAYNFFNYTLDPNVRVIVGDSPELQVGLFPARGDGTFTGSFVASLRYLDDDTPNKTGISDFIALAENALSNITNIERDVTRSSPYVLQHPESINDIVFNAIAPFVQPVFQFFYDVYLVIRGAEGVGGEAAVYVAEVFLFCDWYEGKDFSGANKRFSIGVLLVIYGGILSAVNILSVALLGFDILGLILANAMTMMFLQSTFLTLYSNWAYTCAPGLPVILANDIMYFLAYNLVPKCSWFWGFMFESLYTNENCYSCNGTTANVMTQCRHKVGFLDLTYNIAFIFDSYFPDFVNSLRTSTGLGRVIIDFGPIAARFGHFANVNLEDPFVWARYQGCNWIVTLIPNLYIFAFFFFTAAAIVFPFTGVVSTFFSWLYDVLSQLAVLIFIILTDIGTKIAVAPGATPYPSPSLDTSNYANPIPKTSCPQFAQTTPLTQRISKLREVYRNNEFASNQRPHHLDYRRKTNGIDLTRLGNYLNFAKDNLMGDRKDK